MTILDATTSGLRGWLSHRRGLLIVAGLMVLFPFIVSIVVDGNGIGAVFANDDGNARFLQGLMIELFILALYALSYDLILGVTGLLSFGHAMFFAVGAYTFGIMLKTFELEWPAAFLVVLAAALLQALLFGVVLPRVKGITFALITLGIASMFWIVIQSSDLSDYAGAEIGLQGVPAPARFLDSTNERFIFYLITLTIVVLIIASMTAALAGTIHTIHQPIVTPNIASLGYTVTALLVILIGGVGTISGAVVGAAVFRLLQFYLDRWFGGASDLLIGIAYVLLVLYLPYGIVGTWRVKRPNIAEGRKRLLALVKR